MTYFVMWLKYVGAVAFIYTAVGLCSGLLALVTISLYALAYYQPGFAQGVAAGIILAFVASVLRLRNVRNLMRHPAAHWIADVLRFRPERSIFMHHAHHTDH